MSIRTLALVSALVALLAVACGSDSQGDDRNDVCHGAGWVPVLFVHGSGLDSSSWTNAVRALEDSGYPSSHLLAVDLMPNDGDNILAAESQLSRAVERLLEAASGFKHANACTGEAPSRVAIIAHSMGAVSSRWYAARVAPQRVSMLVSIAGSNHGSNALCGLSGSGNRQMCPAYSDSSDPGDIQVALNGTREQPKDETPFGIGRDTDLASSIPPTKDKRILYLTVRIEPDEWIEPSHSALLDGAGGEVAVPNAIDLSAFDETTRGNYLLEKPVVHDDLPRDENVVRFIAWALGRLR